MKYSNDIILVGDFVELIVDDEILEYRVEYVDEYDITVKHMKNNWQQTEYEVYYEYEDIISSPCADERFSQDIIDEIDEI